MAKGQILKKEILNDLLGFFGKKAFLYNDGKEIRVNGFENGEVVQIKITLTASKDIVQNGEDNILPGEVNNNLSNEKDSLNEEKKHIEPTKEEIDNVNTLLKNLGL